MNRAGRGLPEHTHLGAEQLGPLNLGQNRTHPTREWRPTQGRVLGKEEEGSLLEPALLLRLHDTDGRGGCGRAAHRDVQQRVGGKALGERMGVAVLKGSAHMYCRGAVDLKQTDRQHRAALHHRLALTLAYSGDHPEWPCLQKAPRCRALTCWFNMWLKGCLGGVPMGTALTGGLPITGEEERGGGTLSERPRLSSLLIEGGCLGNPTSLIIDNSELSCRAGKNSHK